MHGKLTLSHFAFLISALALWASGSTTLAAQQVLHEAPGVQWPAAQIEQAAWLSGTWRGVSDEGEEVFESWIGPKGDMLAGVTLQSAPASEKAGVSTWSEHMAITSNGYSLAFHYDVFDLLHRGSEFEEHRLLRIEGDGCKLYFHAITIACKRAEQGGKVIGMTVYWMEPADEWNPKPELFTYRYTRVQ